MQFDHYMPPVSAVSVYQCDINAKHLLSRLDGSPSCCINH